MRLRGQAFSNGEREIFLETENGVERQYIGPRKAPRKIRRKIADVELAFLNSESGKQGLFEILDKLKGVVGGNDKAFKAFLKKENGHHATCR